jgi:hypothetical protein
MNVELLVSHDCRLLLPRAQRHSRQRRHGRLELAGVRWSLGTQQVLMGLAAYKTRTR